MKRKKNTKLFPHSFASQNELTLSEDVFKEERHMWPLVLAKMAYRAEMSNVILALRIPDFVTFYWASEQATIPLL